MVEAKLHFGGQPTEPEVKKLLEQFPDAEQLRGTIISHEQIEAVLDVKHDSSRYRTITTAWRKTVRNDTGVEISGDSPEIVGVGFKVLTHSEQLRYGVSRKMRARRQIIKSHQAIASTDEAQLTAPECSIRDHELFAVKMIHTAMIESRKRLPGFTGPPEVQPKRGSTSA
jgi:hypothetical protein